MEERYCEKYCQIFANNIRKYREELGYSKGYFASLVGCDISYIGKIERSEKYPNLRMILKIALALKISVGDLFTYE